MLVHYESALDSTVQFTPSTGDLAGHTFLVVDAEGTEDYQASHDYVIDVSGMRGTLTTAVLSR